MTLYTIIESFGPEQGEHWDGYVRWRGLPFTRFDSIDGILRPRLFAPESEEDWRHVCSEPDCTHLVTDLEYVRHRRSMMPSGDIVGVRLRGHDESDPAFLGFDLLDGYLDVSLLSNWGNDVEIINRALAPNALIRSYAVVQSIQNQLLSTHSDDAHVEGCYIISIYDPSENTKAPQSL